MDPDSRPSWYPADLFPWTSRFTDVLGHRIHYIDEGQGPTLLLLHGNPTWSFLYREIIRGLRDRFRCLALDYPGFGLSRAARGYTFTPAEHSRVVEAFVAGLGLSQLTVMVQDWGGPIGLGFAGRQPERIDRLIIGNTFAWPVNGDLHFEGFSRAMGGAVGGFFIRHANAFVNVMMPLGTRRPLSAAAMRAYRAPLATPEAREATHIFPREILGSRTFLAEVASGLAGLQDRRVLILWGDRDIAFREKERLHFEQIFTKHRTVPLTGAGHFIQEDAPEAIVAAIHDWWSSL